MPYFTCFTIDILEYSSFTISNDFSSDPIYAGIIVCMCPANERWRYTVTSSLIGWAHTQNALISSVIWIKSSDQWIWIWSTVNIMSLQLPHHMQYLILIDYNWPEGTRLMSPIDKASFIIWGDPGWILLIKQVYLNPLWPTDTMWQHRPGSTRTTRTPAFWGYPPPPPPNDYPYYWFILDPKSKQDKSKIQIWKKNPQT